MPLPAHMTLEGEKQGKIEGSCTQQGREGTILVQAFDHEVFIPRDPQTGAATGKRVHNPLTITKTYDKASPKLYQALTSGEHMKNVVVKLYRIDTKGSEEQYFTTTLEDAIIVSVQPYMPIVLDSGSDKYTHMEKVSFTYRKVTWKWEPDGIESEDDWKVPKS
jgi:type VI secretion system secreted protein Hcp